SAVLPDPTGPPMPIRSGPCDLGMGNLSQLVVPANAGTHTPCSLVLAQVANAFVTSWAVGVMGPRFRGDDGIDGLTTETALYTASRGAGWRDRREKWRRRDRPAWRRWRVWQWPQQPARAAPARAGCRSARAGQGAHRRKSSS